MKKLLTVIVVLIVLGLLCAGVLGVGGGGLWFLVHRSEQAQMEAVKSMELELKELEALEAKAQAEQADLEAQAAAAEAALEEQLVAEEELAEEVEEEEVGSVQATAAPRARPRPAPEPEPETTGVRVVSDDEFDEEEELDLGDMDELLGDDDPMGDIEILDDPEPKGRRKKKNR